MILGCAGTPCPGAALSVPGLVVRQVFGRHQFEGDIDLGFHFLAPRQAEGCIDGALALAATLPAPQADRLIATANAAFDHATGMVALAAGLVLLAAAWWIGRINRAARGVQQGA